jgi:hypothetical protein
MSAAVLIPAENVEAVWPLVEPYVKRVCARHSDQVTEAELLDDAMAGRKQIWMAWDGANKAVQAVFSTSIDEAKDGSKTARLHFCTGQDREQWQDLLADILAWAAQNGCKRFRTIARKGWSEHLADYGFRQTHVVFEKELA